jgi:hypothetical protein
MKLWFECFICVFACILASSRITQSGSWKTDPSFLRWFYHNRGQGPTRQCLTPSPARVEARRPPAPADLGPLPADHRASPPPPNPLLSCGRTWTRTPPSSAPRHASIKGTAAPSSPPLFSCSLLLLEQGSSTTLTPFTPYLHWVIGEPSALLDFEPLPPSPPQLGEHHL